MRDLLILAIVIVSLPIGLFQPFCGILVYAWISYMNPHVLAWTYARTAPVAMLAALSVIAGMAFNQNADTAVLKQREIRCMLALLPFFALSSSFALNPDDAWQRWQDMAKIIIMSVIISAYITSYRRLRLFLVVVALSIGFFGIKGGIFSLATQGQFMVLGPGNSIIGANNNLGLALNMVLPMFWFLAKDVGNVWTRRALQIGFLLIIPAIMFTYSRGSFLGLAVVLIYLIWKTKHRILLAGLLLAGTLILADYVPKRWLDRQSSTFQQEQEDVSVQSRLDNWKLCWNIALDRPLTGAGFRFFTPQVVSRYDSTFLIKYRTTWDTHNIFFGILAGHGFPTCVLFFLMIAFVFATCRSLKKQAKVHPQLSRIVPYADLVQVAIVAWLANGMFVNMEYFELPYHLVAVAAALKVVFNRELAQSSTNAGSGDAGSLTAAA